MKTRPKARPKCFRTNKNPWKSRDYIQMAEQEGF